jgi:uncharacterized membrane protein (DUF485 family)
MNAHDVFRSILNAAPFLAVVSTIVMVVAFIAAWSGITQFTNRTWSQWLAIASLLLAIPITYDPSILGGVLMLEPLLTAFALVWWWGNGQDASQRLVHICSGGLAIAGVTISWHISQCDQPASGLLAVAYVLAALMLAFLYSRNARIFKRGDSAEALEEMYGDDFRGSSQVRTGK